MSKTVTEKAVKKNLIRKSKSIYAKNMLTRKIGVTIYISRGQLKCNIKTKVRRRLTW